VRALDNRNLRRVPRAGRECSRRDALRKGGRASALEKKRARLASGEGEKEDGRSAQPSCRVQVPGFASIHSHPLSCSIYYVLAGCVPGRLARLARRVGRHMLIEAALAPAHARQRTSLPTLSLLARQPASSCSSVDVPVSCL
jgi:hypothetical protein